MSKLKHTRKGRALLLKTTSVKKKRQQTKLRAPPRGRTETEKKNLNYTGNSNFKN